MRKKIVAFSLLLVVLSILTTGLISSKLIIKNIEDDNLAELKNYCSVINKAIEEEFRNNVKPDYIRFAELFSKEIKERVTFIDKEGNVLGDATLGINYVNKENHKYRPEVKSALNGEIGVSTRKSGTFGKSFLYVAVPIFYQGELIVVTRVAMQLDELTAMEKFITETSLISGLIAIVLGLVLSFFYSGFITRPIKSNIRVADNIILGKYKDNIYLNAKDELKVLSNKLVEISQKMEILDEKANEDFCKMEAVLSNMKEAIIAVDNEFHLTMFNKSAKEMFHLNDSDLGLFLIRAIRNAELLTALKKVTNDNFIGDQIIELNNEQTLKMRTQYIMQGEDPKIVGVIALIEDISGKNCKMEGNY
jgi:two-component system phosphate regulon sensor histidine kinase PhoR